MAKDLVDLMGGPRSLPTVPQERSKSLSVEKTHTEPMSMTEFVQWVSDNYGGSVSVKEALQQAAFLLCCDVISQDMAKATLRLRERTTPTTSRIVNAGEHPIAQLLATEPNSRHTWQEFKEMMGFWGCLTQNAYAIVERTTIGDPIEILPLQSGHVTETIDGRSVFYNVTAGTEQERALIGARRRIIPERNMIHVRGRMIDGMYGYSTLLVGQKTLQSQQGMNDYRSTLFGDDGQIRGVFTRDAGLDILPDAAFQRLKDQFRQLMNRMRTYNEPIVLEGGLKFDKISVNPAEAELTKQFETQINEVCRLLRVPPHKVFQLDGSKYENLETLEKAYVGDTMIPVCQRYEQRYNRLLLSEKDRITFFIEHDREEMTIKDTKAETERIIKSVERGLITRNEARAKLGWDQHPSGDTFLVPANMYVIDEDNNILVGSSSSNSNSTDVTNSDSVNNDADSLGLRLISSK